MVIVIGLIMVGSVSLIYNAFSISLREHRQFGLLSSVGATKKQLKKALNYEARSVCILGIPLGILSGLLGIGITLRFIPLMARWYPWRGWGRDFSKISWAAVLAAVLIAWITVKLSRLDPGQKVKADLPHGSDVTFQPGYKIRNTKAGSRGLAGRLFGLEGCWRRKIIAGTGKNTVTHRSFSDPEHCPFRDGGILCPVSDCGGG